MRNVIFGLLLATTTAMVSSYSVARETIAQCDWAANLRNIVEPWDKHTRTFANGKIRIAHVDTGGEPVCCSSYLAILAPTNPEEEELTGRQCALLTDSDQTLGFSWIDFPAITASYDPGLGLLLSVPVERYDVNSNNGSTLPGIVNIRINQATGSITTE